MKKKLMVLITLLFGVFLTACGNSAEAPAEGESASGELVKVGILLSADHASLTNAADGFVDELAADGFVDGENAEINILNAQGSTGNLHEMATQLASENDILLGVSTSAAQALATATKDKPILFTAVTEPTDAGLVDSMETPGGHITGTSDMVPIEEQIDLLFSIVPDAQNIGIIYNSSEANSKVQSDLAEAEIVSHGGTAVIKTVTSTNDVQQIADQLLGQVDGLYIPTDNTLSSAATTVGNLAEKHQVPIVAGSIDHTEIGGLATYGINYESLGHQTGKMAVDILKNGKKPADMPVETASDLELFVNKNMAEALDIDPDSITMDE